MSQYGKVDDAYWHIRMHCDLSVAISCFFSTYENRFPIQAHVMELPNAKRNDLCDETLAEVGSWVRDGVQESRPTRRKFLPECRRTGAAARIIRRPGLRYQRRRKLSGDIWQNLYALSQA